MLYKKRLPVLASLLAIVSVLVLNSCQDHRMPPNPSDVPDVTVYALNDANQLLRFSVRTPSTTTPISISGTMQGERILSVDFRPATGQLYGVSNQSRLYTINPMTGGAQLINMNMTPFTPNVSGTVVGLDFNPTVDRIRLVTNTGQDLRLNPETGTVAATDLPINGVAGAMIAEVAYTNNRAGATTTTLYDIDPATDRLYIQNPPNNGTLVDVGPLGLDITGAAGFDISPTDNTQGLVAVTFNGASELQQINLSTGRLQKLGNLPGNIIGLAIPTEPTAYAVDGSNNLMIFNPMSPSPVTKTLMGLAAGENLVGIDFRPANGQLYALGSSSRLYTIAVTATASWSAVAVGSPGAFTLSGTDFGFDFNPTVDRIRVISNTEQNLRLNPIDGTLTMADGNLNPAGNTITAAAYTNNFVGGPGTTLYDIGVTGGNATLYTQNPPNAGGLVAVGSLGLTGVESTNGFDIGGMSNIAYALLRSGGTTRIYSINLTSGTATAGMALPGNPAVRGFALGLGF